MELQLEGSAQDMCGLTCECAGELNLNSEPVNDLQSSCDNLTKNIKKRTVQALMGQEYIRIFS